MCERTGMYCPYRSRVDQRAGVSQHRRLARLKTNHVNNSLVPSQLEECFGLRATARQRPLAVHVLPGIDSRFHELLVLGHAHTNGNRIDVRVLRELARIVENMLGSASLGCSRRGIATRIADCGDAESGKERKCRHM